MKISVQFMIFFIAIFCLALFCLALFCSCVNMSTAGGTTDTENSRIAAVIFTQDGKAAAGVKVTVFPKGYLPSIGADSSTVRILNVKEFITNDIGYFNIPSIDTGAYFIEVDDGNSCAVSLQVVVSSDSSTITLNDTLKPYSTLKGNFESVSDSSPHRFLLIYGLDRRIPVTIDGAFVINNLPAGIFHLRIISESPSYIPFEIDSIQTIPSEIVTIPFAGWSYSSNIVLNTTSSGVEIEADVFNFPMLVRLSNKNFNFSQAKGNGRDCRFAKMDKTPIPFNIEQWDSSQGQASIWVLMDTIHGNSSQTITMHWGNPNAGSLTSNSVIFDTANGCLGNYHFAGNLKDETVNRYDGTDSGTTDSPAGIIGRARAFNGSTSFFNLGDLPDRPSGTISFWFKPGVTFNSSSAKTQGIWGKKSSDVINYNISLRGKDFYADSGSASSSVGNLIAKLEGPDTGCYLESTTNSFSTGVWYFVVWSWGSGGNYMYVNGVLENSSPNSRPVSGSARDEIGRSLYDGSNIQYGAAGYFNGLLDEFRIDDATRNESWIKLCYINQGENDRLISFK